jgi:pyruvate/2-oxoglutarate dehydrogenase complex dihydrolipoamide acyltransferase (E2) component
MDPFCVIHLSNSKDEKFKTKVAKNGHRNPTFEQSYIFNLEGKEELLHCNAWHEATLGDDHIGRLDLSLDALDMSGTKRWYQLKDKTNFTKETGEICMSIIFDGHGLPVGSVAEKTTTARLAPAASPAASPAAATASPVATVAPPVIQASQQYQSVSPAVSRTARQHAESPSEDEVWRSLPGSCTDVPVFIR